MDAIIFDLDGTLWDAMDVVFQAWHDRLQRSELPHCSFDRAFLQSCMGKTAGQIAALLFPDVPEQARLSEMLKLYAYENELLKEQGGTLYPAVPETLARLREKYQLFVVSNAQDGYVQAFLRWSGLDCFRDIEMEGRTGKSKAENIRLVMERNDISRAVYVGDTQGDANSAREAGVPFIFAAYGFGSVDHADAEIQTFADLPKAAAAFF